MDGQVPLEQQIAIARRHGIPADRRCCGADSRRSKTCGISPRWARTWCLFSGGKGLCGPQSSGLILGRRDLIEACAFNACPRPFIGRPMKVGKEEIVGLMAAVRWYLDLDHAALMQTYEDQVGWIVAAFSGAPHVQRPAQLPQRGRAAHAARRDHPGRAGPRYVTGRGATPVVCWQPSHPPGPCRSEWHLRQPTDSAGGQERIIVERILRKFW